MVRDCPATRCCEHRVRLGSDTDAPAKGPAYTGSVAAHSREPPNCSLFKEVRRPPARADSTPVPAENLSGASESLARAPMVSSRGGKIDPRPAGAALDRRAGQDRGPQARAVAGWDRPGDRPASRPHRRPGRDHIVYHDDQGRWQVDPPPRMDRSGDVRRPAAGRDRQLRWPVLAPEGADHPDLAVRKVGGRPQGAGNAGGDDVGMVDAAGKTPAERGRHGDNGDLRDPGAIRARVWTNMFMFCLDRREHRSAKQCSQIHAQPAPSSELDLLDEGAERGDIGP